MGSTTMESNTTTTVKGLVGLGNPLLDISANVTQKVLEQYDLKLDNAILAEEHHKPLYTQLLAQSDVECVAGGATLNSIRVAQWMLKEKAPHKTSFFGCIGEDEYGKELTNCAEKDGVQVHYLKDAETETGTCAVCIKDTERSLVANLGAANKFKVEHLEDVKSQEIIDNAQVFYSAGFHLTVCPDAMVRLGKHCAEENKIFCMNLSAPFLMEFFHESMNRVLPYTDFVFGNEGEAAGFGKMKGWGEDLKVIALKLSQLPKESGAHPRVVVFTQGKDPTIVACHGKVLTFDTPTVDIKDIVDSNGAGDAFVGGFLSQLMQEKELAKCIEAGIWAAQVIIQQSGCTFPETCDYSSI